MTKMPGPGLARAKNLPFFVQKTMVRGHDARWREAFGRADLVSEGGIKATTYFGSTSILLPMAAADQPQVLEVAHNCVHVRLRAVRLARREAEVRSQAELGVSRCEVKIVADPRGLRIDVDLEAPLLRGAASKAARAR